MKKILLSCLVTCTLLTSMDSFAAHTFQLNDTINLPDCIKKLNHPGTKGIRSYAGGMKYRKIHITANGKMLYAFNSEASIGCYANQPAGTKYYNDSCRYVAYFPAGFSIKEHSNLLLQMDIRPLIFPNPPPAITLRILPTWQKQPLPPMQRSATLSR